MSQKIWVLEDIPEKHVSDAAERQKNISLYQQQSIEERNPSIAFSTSIIVWGAGQFYNRNKRLGILFLLAMINFYMFLGILVIYWDSILSSFTVMDIDSSDTLLMISLFYISGIVLWYMNAWQAYFQCVKNSTRSLKGLKMTVLPVMCSLLIPGWGQLLNGQAKKGLFFQLFAATGFGMFPLIWVIYSMWPTLEPTWSRLILEWLFSIGTILIPLILVVWLFNILDAAVVSANTLKKECLSTRMKLVIKKFRYLTQVYGWKNAVVLFIKRIAPVMLLLAICGISYQYIPQKFYMRQLQSLEGRLSDKEMTVIPDLIRKLSWIISD